MSDARPAPGSRFFQYAAIAMAAVVFIGFARTFFLKPLFPEAREFAAPEPYFLLHGAVFTAWMLWLIMQATLVRGRRIELHRKLGRVGAAIAVLVVGLGVYGAVLAARRPGGFIGVDMPPEQFLAIPVATMLCFGVFVTLAVAWRRNPQSHKRAMLLATVNLLEAAFVRFPFAFMPAYAPLSTLGSALLFIVALGIHDRRSLGRVHSVTLWGGIAIALSFPAAIAVSGTNAWLRLARWMIEALA